MELCAEQLEAARLCIASPKRVVVLTGAAGSGKSTVIHHLRKRSDFVVCATTGRAAVNVDGVTVDSLFAISRERWECYNESYQTSVMFKIPDNILIDEASMVGTKMGNLIASAAKMFKKRIILVGDWAQARPVKDDWILGSDLAEDVEFIKLLTNHRQETDLEYMAALNDLRLGQVTDQVNHLMTRLVRADPDEQADLRLYATNKHADTYNRYRLMLLVEQEKLGYVVCRSEFADKRSLAKAKGQPRNSQFIERAIESSKLAHGQPLTVGAKIVITWNDDQGARQYVNGDTGVIVEMTTPFGKTMEPRLRENPGKEQDVLLGTMSVLLDRTGEMVLLRQKVVETRDPTGQHVQHQVTGWPVSLGYALTIHKAQGMTLNRAWVHMQSLLKFPDDTSRHGLAYVALSRTRTAAGLTINSWCPSAVYCDPAIKAWI